MVTKKKQTIFFRVFIFLFGHLFFGLLHVEIYKIHKVDLEPTYNSGNKNPPLLAVKSVFYECESSTTEVSIYLTL